MVVVDLLLESFDDIFDVSYTARMEEELDEIEEGKIDWRAAMSEFYERFDRDLKQAEEHMTDIKRMEKPTDLTCEKCGRPLVVKWGKHGSFLACTGYPDFSPRNADADIDGIQKDIAKRLERERKDSDERSTRISARHETDLAKLMQKGEPDRELQERRRKINLRYQKDLEDLLKRIKERKRADRDAISLRLEKLKVRYPQIEQFYDDLALKDSSEGMVFSPTKNSNFCTYTRELTVDLPDLDKANLSEQGEEEYCENCGRPMVLKKGRFGTFFACSGYPDCKTTKQIGGSQQKADVPLEEKCPNCGNHLVLKTGRFGEFTACSNYPTCKYVKQKTIGVKCPECTEGEVIERRSKKGKTFYGCNRYPDCKFVAWGKPVAEKCPDCGSPYLIEKWLKAGPVWQCPNAECKHKQDAPQAAVPA
jgi:DNA topoisomerase-1